MPGGAGAAWCPRPAPQRIVDFAVIGHLARAGYLVVACGGGGIPVVEDAAGALIGVEAVIDKDLASSLLARSIGADLLLVSTGVEKVADRLQQAESPLARPDDGGRGASAIMPRTSSTKAAWGRRSRR